MAIRLGIAPIAWSNDDLPELGGDTPLEVCLKESREAGFSDHLVKPVAAARIEQAIQRLVGEAAPAFSSSRSL